MKRQTRLYSQFTAAEDRAIWRVVIKDGGKTKHVKIGRLIKERLGSQRTPASLLYRFRDILLPRLRSTKFHTETKLKQCKAHRIPVGDDFLRELEKDAYIELDERDLVTSFTMKPKCRKNYDKELSDEDFMEAMTPIIVKNKPFTEEEDAELWNHVLKNHERFRLSFSFWKTLSQKLNRLPPGLLHRFKCLCPTIHLQGFSVEDSLKLYKSCKVTVDKKYLKELMKHAELEMNEKGCITWYRLRNDRVEKRKSTGESGLRAKKARGSEAADADQEDEELDDEDSEDTKQDASGENSGSESNENEENVVVDNIAWDVVASKVPKEEPIDDYEQFEQPVVSTNIVVAELFDIPKTQEVDSVHSQEKVIFDENQFDVAAEETVEQEEENQTDTISIMAELIQSVEERFENQEAAFNAKLSTMKAELEASFEAKMMRVMAEGTGSVQGNVRANPGTSEDLTSVNRKQCLSNLETLIGSFDSPETAALKKKIEAALKDIPENDERQISKEVIAAVIRMVDQFVDRLL